MKLLTTIHNLNNINELLNLADGLVVGLNNLSTRETSYLTITEINNIGKIIKENNKELFLSLKPFLHEQDNEVINFIQSLKVNIDGIIVGDIGYYYLLKDLNIPIIYNPETLITNSNDLNIFYDIGLKGLFLSKEIHLDDLKEMINNKKGKAFIVGHGHLNMFYSKRKLLTSYFDEINKPFIYENKSLLIKEEKRDEYMPIIEDQFGTHVYRSSISSVINYLEDFKGLDYLLVDSFLYDDSYNVDVLKMFKGVISKEEVENKYKQIWDDGFLNKKTIYKRNLND